MSHRWALCGGASLLSRRGSPAVGPRQRFWMAGLDGWLVRARWRAGGRGSFQRLWMTCLRAGSSWPCSWVWFPLLGEPLVAAAGVAWRRGWSGGSGVGWGGWWRLAGGSGWWRRPVGSVNTTCPVVGSAGLAWVSDQSPSCTTWWCALHNSTRFHSSVGPRSSQWMTWWASHHDSGRSQPGNTQPPSRTTRAVRCAVVTVRVRRPTSSTWLVPPMTAGMTPESQARRRTVAGVSGTPSEVSQRPGVLPPGAPSPPGF